MNNKDLKPCPFCGGRAHIKTKAWDVFTYGAFIECVDCGARTEIVEPSCDYAAVDKAAELWNKRVKG